MYESYWQLAHAPFENGTDARFYYPSEGHQANLLKLRYTIESRKGGAVLAGDRGAGKTLLVEMLRRQLPDTFRPFVHVVFPQMPPADLLAYVAGEILGEELGGPRRHLESSIRALQKALAENTANRRHAVIAVDEAHLIDDPACWDTLRLLLNFQSDGRCDLTLLLVGQIPLLTMIERMNAWEDRLAVKCLVKPLTRDEAACYVQHRLKLAGRATELFTPDAVTALHRLSHGFPRRLNRLADLALVVGFAEQLDRISPHEIDAISCELTTSAVE